MEVGKPTFSIEAATYILGHTDSKTKAILSGTGKYIIPVYQGERVRS